MNCYEWLDVAIGYAESILDEYGELCRLALKGLTNTDEYLKRLKKLKNIVECERIFYSLMDECELDFISHCLLSKEEVSTDISLVDILFQSVDSIYLDELLWNRVYRLISKYLSGKNYPLLSCSTKQVGMISLLPYQEQDDVVHYMSKTAIIEGCFHMHFSKSILKSTNYSSRTKIKFLYFSSYSNEIIENYYLQTDFQFEEEKIDSILEIYDGHYFEDSNQYNRYCFDLFELSYLSYVKNVLNYSKEELDLDALKGVHISIVRDMCYSYLSIIPYNSMKNTYDEILKLNGTSVIKDYFVKKLNPLIVSKTAKVMKLEKSI